MQIKADLPVSITLPAGAWLALRGHLGRGPYDDVAPLIAAINQHLEAAALAAETRNGNGEDRPVA